MATLTLIQAIREALWEEMERDERVILLGLDIGQRGGVFRVTDGFLARFGERRVIDTPLSESAIVGVAIGAAANGFRPVVEIQFADFIHSAMDQIINEAAKLRYRSRGAYGCPLVIRAPFGAGVHGGLYHSQCVEALFCHVPGLKVVVPSTPADAKGLLKSAIRDPDPVLFFEHKRAYRHVRGPVPAGDYTIPLGQADIKRPGEQISLITYGLMVHHALEAAEIVAREGISVEVVDLRTLVPLDRETILTSVKKTGKVVIAHEDTRTGGFGGEIAALIAEEAFEYLDGPIVRVAAPDVPAMPYSPPLEEYCLPGPADLVAALRRLAAY